MKFGEKQQDPILTFSAKRKDVKKAQRERKKARIAAGIEAPG